MFDKLTSMSGSGAALLIISIIALLVFIGGVVALVITRKTASYGSAPALVRRRMMPCRCKSGYVATA